MYLLTLEGLPHSGRCAVLRALAKQCPHWATLNAAAAPANTCSWASSDGRAHHALFASLIRKLQAVSSLGCGNEPAGGVVLLSNPWFEHLPRHPAMWRLMSELTKEAVRCLACPVRQHIMVLIHVSGDETFEQMVCCGSALWNGTSLADVHATQVHITQQMHEPSYHPFPAVTYTIHCPPFFEENEIVLQGIVQDIKNIVTTLTAPPPPPTETTASTTTPQVS